MRFKSLKTDLSNHTTEECGHKLHGEYIHKFPAGKEKKPKVKMYNKYGLQQLIVPSRAVQSFPGIWPNKNYQKLKKASYVFTKEDKMQMIEEAQRKQDDLYLDSFKRKENLERSKLDQRAIPGSKLYNKEHIAARRSMYILQRALELRQEQEDDIKYANRVILLGKCVNVRKKQIAEKEIIKNEIQEEEDRLYMMMEQDRQRKIKKEDNKKAKTKEECLKTFEVLKEQIREREHHKLLEIEHKKEENRMILKRLAIMKEEDEEKLRKKHREQLKIREELNIANEKLLHIKNLQKEEQRIADCRIEEFVRVKTLREAEHNRILAEQKAHRDRKIALLQQLQEKMQTQKAAGDELKAQKIQREFERQRKENDRIAEIKRKKVIEDLIKGRHQQVEDYKRGNRLEQQLEKSDLNRFSKIANDLYEKDLEKQRLRDAAAKKYRKDLLEQIHHLEIDRIHKIKQKFEEGFNLKYKMEEHELTMKTALEKKIQRLHETNVPQCVIKDIERMLHM